MLTPSSLYLADATSLIAIMLGRLGMTVDECMSEYLDLFERLSAELDETTQAESSPSQIRSSVLRETISGLLERRGLPQDMRLRNDQNVTCYT